MRKVAGWVMAVLFTGLLLPVLADLISDFVSKDPERAIGWLIGALSSVTELSWFYPALTFISGLAIGAWLDVLLRRFDGGREEARRSLGYRMQNLALEIADRQKMLLVRPWPQNIADMRPRLQSCWIRADAIGIWVPDSEVLTDRADGAELLVGYLHHVGTLLIDGHFSQAKGSAASFKQIMEEAPDLQQAKQ
jgi:hypothetical protein